MGKGTEYRKLKETAKVRVEDLQDKFTRLQYASNDGAIDVAVLQEEVSQILKDWNNELNQPSPASSLQQQGSSLGFSSLERLLEPLDEEDDATSGLTPLKADLHAHETGQSAPLYEDLIGQYNIDPSGFATVGADCTTADTTGLDNLLFDLPQDFGLDFSTGLDFWDHNQGEAFLPEVTGPPPPSAFLGPKCALWDCPRPAQGGCCPDYCSTLHAGNAQTEGMPGMKPVVRPKGIELNDNLLVAALSAKTQGKNVGVPECEGAATTKAPWNAPEFFDISMFEGETIREWLFFDKPRRAFESGTRKQRSLPDYHGRGWHESRKQVLNESKWHKKSYYMDPQPQKSDYMDPQPMLHLEWHLFVYETSQCDAFALYRLELKVVDGKTSMKGLKKKIDNDPLTELQKQMSQLTAEFPVDSGNKTSVKGRGKANLKAKGSFIEPNNTSG